MEITSVNNELVKKVVKLQQKKYRNIEGKFLLEGYKAIKEAFDCGIEIEHIFVQKEKKNEYIFAKNLLIETNEPVLKKLATTDSAPEAIAVGLQKKYDKNILKNAKKILLLEDIKDLGNLGTIIRSAVAFGADGIILYGESVDIYNPKAVRASVGNLWKIPIFQMKNIDELKLYFQKFNRIATLPRAKNLLKEFTPELPTVIMFGSEANGLSDELVDFATNSVKIEMQQTVESLNLATSVSIVLYELFV
jgi:TrmH family RNA methyltransferase